MRPKLHLAVLSIAVSIAGHAQFVDDFSDGDLTNDPTWEGDAGAFIVNADQELQINNTIAATSQLHSTNAMATLDDQEWRVQVRQGFSPSSSNFSRVYLVSDQNDLTGPLNGYFLQFGEAGSNDAIELFEQSGTFISSVCRGTEGLIANSFEVGVKVVRDGAGVWQLLVDPSGGSNYGLQASGLSSAFNSSSSIGVLCVYTVSNAEDFYFDDFYAGPLIVDTEAPFLVSASANNAFEVELVFNESVEELSAEEVGNYALIPAAGIASVLRDGIDPTIVRLTLSSALMNGVAYTVTASGVLDFAGNPALPTSAMFTYAAPVLASFRDVVINEIMADPSPVVGLPEVEFVELFNASADRTFDLEGWTFGDGGTPVSLPSYVLAPGAHVVLMSATSLPLFPSVSNKIGLSSLPALNNDGDPLDLRDDDGSQVDQVSYELSWYQDAIKDDGGWTLEQIDPTAACSGAENWRASEDPSGGTPGEANSVFEIIEDLDPPTLVSVLVSGATSLSLVFSESLDQASAANAEYLFDPPLDVASVSTLAGNTVLVELASAMVGGTVYRVSVEGLSDCAGNPLAADDQAAFGLPQSIEVGDLVLNEVLYDPIGSGSDFVELFNRSDKILSLAGLRFANVSDGVVGDGELITTEGVLLFPGDHLQVCEDLANIAALYPRTVIEHSLESDLPSFNNGSGSVVLLGGDGGILDRFDYSDDLHFELIDNTEGYSLERVDPDRPTSDDTNWQSASDIAGRATPGFQNSQYAKSPDPKGTLVIEPAIFSPDNDGFQDVLTIGYTVSQPGAVGNLTIYDITGREARLLLQNQLLGTSGAISWDGVLEEGSVGRVGAYIVVFELFDLDGAVERHKRTVTLAQRLD